MDLTHAVGSQYLRTSLAWLANGLLSGRVDMSMQLSATPAANTLAATDASEAPAAGAWTESLTTDAHSPGIHTEKPQQLVDTAR